MKIKNELYLTGLFYLSLVVLTIFGEMIYKTDMAGPGGGMIVLFFGFIGVIGLLIRNIIYFKRGKDHKIALLIHVLVVMMPFIISACIRLFK